jgi:NADPH:quinone reductase-like Zn-dependent oxidoreductase
LSSVVVAARHEQSLQGEQRAERALVALGLPAFAVELPLEPLNEGGCLLGSSLAMFAAKIPDGLAVESAGALGLAGATALAAIDAIDPKPGEVVLISGATGGIGSFAVQLAKVRGATVIATARTEDADYVTGLGADATVDYDAGLNAAVRAQHPDGIDAIVHAAGDGAQLATLLKPGGRIASTIGLTAEQVEDAGAKVTTIMVMPTWLCRRPISTTGSPLW